MGKVKAAVNGVKKVAAGIKKTLKKIGNAVKFFASPFGFIILILILVIIVVILVAIAIETLGHAISMWLDESYPGISTEGDYNYLVSSIGYAGYDSLITEQKWQEYLAFEYAVLMDVAEYLAEGQEAFENGVEGSYTEEDEKHADGTIVKVKSPAYMPYLNVSCDYDLSNISFEDWQKATIKGQSSARNGYTNPADIGAGGTGYTAVGGNRNVSSPWISYEFKTNSYEENAGSYVPYITILKEALRYTYYTVGAEDASKYEAKGAYATNSENEGVFIGEENISDINLLERNYKLNALNPYIPTSSEYARKLLKEENLQSLDVTNSSNWLIPDTEFKPELYYTSIGESVVYKMPLQRLIDRYLPKASLLTAWYLVKDGDIAEDKDIGKAQDETTTEVFDVNGLMADIKNIYNYYCWDGETRSGETVKTVQYDKDGKVVRDPETEVAVMSEAELPYTTTNKQTFVHFGQAGVEANFFYVYNDFAVKQGSPTAPNYVTGDEKEETVPIVTNLLAKNIYFLNSFAFEVEYKYSITEKKLVGKYTSEEFSKYFVETNGVADLRDDIDISGAGIDFNRIQSSIGRQHRGRRSWKYRNIQI